MRILLVLLFAFYSLQTFAQRKCEYTTEVKDSLGSLKTTKEVLLYERIFGQNEQYLFFSLTNDDGTPYLTLQQVQKNNAFIKATCIDASTKMYVQLENGKIITLLHVQEENCGNFFYNDNKNIRVLSANFMFLKDSFKELKESPINIIRIKYSTETIDYRIKPELQSELLKEFNRPANFFIDYLHCVE
ncbi:hypothetical protein [Flavobacterium filum]|uniref:hypothetical protein n=1 Tax=Flavobacterium filum TaxID=370974 RepID=UPI0023F350ED|nr:hypothetical protein [Flavobacterium filum]